MLDLAIDQQKRLRQALGTFATGVTVVTTVDEEGSPRGFTANSFTSVSLEPPLILVCIANDAATCPVFMGSEHFCVNILAEDQQDIAAVFASQNRTRFEHVTWRAAKYGSPLLDGALTHFECRRTNSIDAGDHAIIIGEVLDYGTSGRSPLVYCSGSYVEFGLLQQAVEAGQHGVATRISAIVNFDGAIPMVRDPGNGNFLLPSADRVGTEADPETLVGKLAANGIDAEIPFVCAVYEDADQNTHNVVFRGTARTVEISRLKDFELIALDDIPWEKLVDQPLKQLLERYLEESEQDAFGLYIGDNMTGKVHPLKAGA